MFRNGPSRWIPVCTKTSMTASRARTTLISRETRTRTVEPSKPSIDISCCCCCCSSIFVICITHTSISLHPAVHQLKTAMLQTKYISLCLQHLAVNVMDRYGVCPCMWYILQLLTQWQHQYGQHTYQHSSLSANIPVCNTLLTEEIMPICKIYICALLLPSLIYVQNTNCSTLPSTRSAYTANAANYWPQQQIM